MKPDPQQVVADLLASADYLENFEWHQDGLFRYGWQTGSPRRITSCCAFGAALLATGEHDLPLAEQIRSADVARAFYRVRGEGIIVFNDAEGRTKTEVVQALRDVAEAVKEDTSRA